MEQLLVALVAGVVGLLFGSFANVPIHRWPRGAGVTEPARSACPACGVGIAPRDNVPVVSWVVLRGRCRHCGAPIHWRYPLVEAVTGLLFGLVAWVTTWSAVVATAIDLEHRIIPNRMTYPLPAVLLLLLLPPTFLGPGSPGALLRGALTAVVVPGAFLLVAEVYRRLRGRMGFGMGDVKYLVSLGLVCGYLGGFEVAVLLYGAMTTAVVVIVALLAAGRVGMASRIPFGPYLAAGALLAILLGERLRPIVLGALGLR